MNEQPANASPENVEAPEEKPPRIKKLTLCNFRAFPGPQAIPFNVAGKNAVVYGENGAGKSSIFHALDGIFSIADKNNAARKTRLENAANLFSGEDKNTTSVKVEFDDNTAEEWTTNNHPCNSSWNTGPDPDSRVYPAAYRKAILDYRSLLETNFRHTSGAINLFDVCVNVALRDYHASYEGSEIRLKELWSKLEYWIYPPKSRYRYRNRSEIPQLALAFNQGVREALDALVQPINEMLKEMGWEDIEIDQFEFSGITYNNEHQLRLRDFNGKKIVPSLKFEGKTLSSPHLFLNEARLSALALAIYFSARILCARTNLPHVPKIMVLDDIVIGLDRSNRLPLLDLLANHFKDWQVFILTHDRVWYDMIRSYQRRHLADKFWSYWELNENENKTIPPILLQASSSAPKQALDQAREFLKNGHINAAGNAARIAAERAVREFCEVKKAPVPYKNEIEKVPFSDILAGAEKWSNTSANAAYKDALSNIKMYQQILLNKLSHGSSLDLTKHEVQGAITAVDGLLLALKVTSKYENPKGPTP